MKQIIRLIILSIFLNLSLSSTDILAQTKIGHLNSAELLNGMSEAKQAEKELESYTNRLDKDYKSKLKALESEYKAIQLQVKNGELTGKQVAAKEKEFVEKQKEVQGFEAKAQQDIMKKREALLSPILKKVKDAINAVGKEKGYDYIVDMSLGAVLYATESEDITALVKAKL